MPPHQSTKYTLASSACPWEKACYLVMKSHERKLRPCTAAAVAPACQIRAVIGLHQTRVGKKGYNRWCDVFGGPQASGIYRTFTVS